MQDGRHKRGVRYQVALILTLIMLAKLAGMSTPAAIAEWVRLRADWVRQVLPVARETFPCASTYSNVLRTLDAEQVNQVLTQRLLRIRAMECCGEEPSRLVGPSQHAELTNLALDGKTLWGTLGHVAADQKKMHQLGLYETQTGMLLKEQVTGEKQNELSIVSEFLTPVLVKGRIISADALHTQCAFCFRVKRWKGHYVLIAKDNQPTQAEDLRLFFTEPPADCRDWRTARNVNKGHGRLEIRELVASTELNEFLGSRSRISFSESTTIPSIATKRAYYSGFFSVEQTPFENLMLINPLREHRLYQASFYSGIINGAWKICCFLKIAICESILTQNVPEQR